MNVGAPIDRRVLRFGLEYLLLHLKTLSGRPLTLAEQQSLHRLKDRVDAEEDSHERRKAAWRERAGD